MGVRRILLGKPEGKRHRHRWEDNIKMVLKNWDGVVWTEFIWL
jgi:hypothetical protein